VAEEICFIGGYSVYEMGYFVLRLYVVSGDIIVIFAVGRVIERVKALP